MGFIDLFKDFHREAIRQEFPTSARVLYDILLYEFNGRYWTEEIGFSERDLSALTGLSAATVHRAVKFLSDRNFIKTRRAKHGTAFKLLGENVPEEMKQSRSSNEAVVKQERSSCEAVEANPNIRVRDKTEDFKTTDLQSINPPRACAPVNWDCENELATLWLDNGGARVTAELLSYLQALTEKHGVEWTAQAIREAAGAFSGDFAMSLNFLRGCVKRKLEGGERDGAHNARVVSLYRRPASELPGDLRRGDARRTASPTVAGRTGNGRFDAESPDTSWIYETLGDG